MSSSIVLRFGLAALALCAAPVALAAATDERGILVDDFEDGDRLTALRTGWVLGGNPASIAGVPFEANPMPNPAGTGRRLEVHARLAREASAQSPWVSVSCGVPPALATEGGRRTCGVTFRFSGSPSVRHVLQAWTPEVTDGCHFEVELPADSAPQVVHVRWESFRQPRWGRQLGAFRPASITGLAWIAQGPDGADACMTIDDLFVDVPDDAGACPPVTEVAKERASSASAMSDLARLRQVPFANVRLVPRKIDLAVAVTRIPVDFRPNPVIEVRLNGQGPFPLVFDTGADATVLTSNAATRLGLRPRARVRVQGFHEDSVSDHAIAHLDEVSVGGFTARDIDVGVANFVGPPARGVDGFIGIGAMDGLLITLDGPAAELRLERGQLPIDAADVVSAGKGLMPAITVAFGDATRRCGLDTGSGSLLDLRDDDVGALGITPHLRPVGWMSDVDGRVRHDRSARWEGSATFSGIALEKPIIGSGAHACIVGSAVFRETVTTFDTRSHRVRVTHEAGPITTPPAKTRGFYVEWQCGRCVVADVLPGTAAEAMGLTRGAFVESLDGISVDELGEEGARDRLRADAVVRVGLEGGREIDVAKTIVIP